jgi:hypothetical protein
LLNTSLNLPGKPIVEDLEDLKDMMIESNLNYAWLPDVNVIIKKMKLELFSTPIFITNIDLDKIKIESENFAKEWHSNTLSSFGFTNKLNASSYNYLMSVICSLLSNHLHAENELQLLNIWENKYEKDDFQENHIHTDSHFSFIIYVKGKKSNTVFFRPHINI